MAGRGNPAVLWCDSWVFIYRQRPKLTLTRSANEGRNLLPRLRFGLV